MLLPCVPTLDKAISYSYRPGAIFTTVYFIRNLQIGPIGQSVTLQKAGNVCQRQTLQLIGLNCKLRKKCCEYAPRTLTIFLHRPVNYSKKSFKILDQDCCCSSTRNFSLFLKRLDNDDSIKVAVNPSVQDRVHWSRTNGPGPGQRLHVFRCQVHKHFTPVNYNIS